MEKSKEKVDDFFSAFPSLAQEKEQIESAEEEIETFYLWETLSDYLEIYKILLNYLSEYHAIDTAILLELIKSRNLPMERALKLIPHIHSGYLDIILEKNNGN